MCIQLQLRLGWTSSNCNNVLTFYFCYRERPKPQLKEGNGTSRFDTKPVGEASGTVMVRGASRVEETIRSRCVGTCLYQSLAGTWSNFNWLVLSCSNQGKPLRNAGWDFSIGGSSTGTVRSAAKPPQSRDKKLDVTDNQGTVGRNLENDKLRSAASSSMLQDSTRASPVKDARDPYHSELQDYDNEDVRIFESLTLPTCACSVILDCCYFCYIIQSLESCYIYQ